MTVRIVPLGGLGEFGANSLLLDFAGRRVLVDAGAAFSGLESFGVSREVLNYGDLHGDLPDAVVLTHGHDDHVRGLAALLEARPDVAVWGSRGTLARAGRGFDGPGIAGHELSGGERVAVAEGVWCEPVPVSHSIPASMTVRLDDGQHRIVVATDLRLAPSALGERTSEDALAAWGDAGVDLLFLDGTNALVQGVGPSESEVEACLTEEIRRAPGAVVVVTFASHVGRFSQVARAAAAAGRVVIAAGTGLGESLDLFGRLGSYSLPPGSRLSVRDLGTVPRDRLVIVATGSQGERGSVFPQLAAGIYPDFRLGAGDVVLHAARIIPGNERRLARLFDACVRTGAIVVTGSDRPLHASGHAPVPELKRLLELLRPRVVVPIHGRMRNLAAVAALAASAGFRAELVENGDELELSGGEVRRTGTVVEIGRRLYGDLDDDEVDPAALHQRRVLAHDGLVLAVVTRTSGNGLVGPAIRTVGCALAPEILTAIATRLAVRLRGEKRALVGDDERLHGTMLRWLRSELRRHTRQRPHTAVVVLES